MVGEEEVPVAVGAQKSEFAEPGLARRDMDSPVVVLTHQHDPSKHCIGEKLPSDSHCGTRAPSNPWDWFRAFSLAAAQSGVGSMPLAQTFPPQPLGQQSRSEEPQSWEPESRQTSSMTHTPNAVTSGHK